MPLAIETFAPIDRLLKTVRLAQPRDSLLRQIFAWASGVGTSIFTIEQLRELQRISVSGDHPHLQTVANDIELGLDAIAALEKAPADGWAGYIREWESQIVTDRLFTRGSFGQLRSLQEKLGGVLLSGRARPFVLMIPQADGTWVQCGWETVIHLADCPLTTNTTELAILKEHYHDSSGPLPLTLAPTD